MWCMPAGAFFSPEKVTFLKNQPPAESLPPLNWGPRVQGLVLRLSFLSRDWPNGLVLRLAPEWDPEGNGFDSRPD